MKDYDSLGLKWIFIPFLLLFGVFSFIPLGPTIWNYGSGTAGVCIFKGPAIGGGLFSAGSSGIPLRGIVIKVSHPSQDDTPESFFTDGTTDRTGCFNFKGAYGQTYVMRYFYNGQEYADEVSVGRILQDNLP